MQRYSKHDQPFAPSARACATVVIKVTQLRCCPHSVLAMGYALIEWQVRSVSCTSLHNRLHFGVTTPTAVGLDSDATV